MRNSKYFPSDLYIILIFLLLTVIFFSEYLFSGKVFTTWDIVVIYYPFKEYLHQLFKLKELFLWNPYIFSGIPLPAMLEESLFYPFNIIFLVFPVLKAFVYYAFIHIFLTQVSMFYFLRHLNKSRFVSVAGAVFWGFSGYVIYLSMSPQFMAGPLFLPLLLLMFDKSTTNKKYIIPASLTLSLIILAGSVYIIYYTVIILFLWVLYRVLQNKQIKILPIFFLIIISAFSICAVALLPFVELIHFSPRNIVKMIELADITSFTYEHLIHFFIPIINFNYKYPSPPINIHLGFLPLIIIFIGIIKNKAKGIFMGFMGLFFLSASLGPKFFTYNIIAFLCPFFDKLRFPHYIIFISFFFLLFLFVLGFECLENLNYRIKALVIIILFFELFFFGRKLFIGDNEKCYKEAHNYLNFIKTQTVNYNQPMRISYYPLKDKFSDLLPKTVNWGMMHGLENIIGNNAFVYYPYIEYLYFNETKKMPEENPQEFANLINCNYEINITNNESSMFKLLNARCFVQFKIEENIYRVVEVENYPNSLPRFFYVNNYKKIKNKKDRLLFLSGKVFEPMREVILEEDIPGFIIGYNRINDNKNYAKLLEYNPDYYKIEAISSQNSILYLSQIFYPGWEAYIDGVKTKIYRANHIFMAIPTTSGNHVVEIKYNPKSFKIGLAISIISLIINLAFLFIFNRKSVLKGFKA